VIGLALFLWYCSHGALSLKGILRPELYEFGESAASCSQVSTNPGHLLSDGRIDSFRLARNPDNRIVLDEDSGGSPLISDPVGGRSLASGAVARVSELDVSRDRQPQRTSRQASRRRQARRCDRDAASPTTQSLAQSAASGHGLRQLASFADLSGQAYLLRKKR